MDFIRMAAGLAMLVCGGEFLVSGASGIARKMGVSAFMIGAVIVGFGTSMPEMTTSLIAGMRGSSGIAVGNIVGSNIANIFLILGAASVIRPLKIDKKAFGGDAIFLGMATAAVIIAALVGQINAVMGGVFVAMLGLYVIMSYRRDRASAQDQATAGGNPWVFALKAIAGIALLIFGARLLVDGSIALARLWGVSETIIGLTIVAVGTSLPELAASSIASIKGNSGIAVGNVVGSNIFNVFLILGLTAMFVPLEISGMGTDIAIMSFATAMLGGMAYLFGGFSRIVGLVFLAAYAGYLCMTL